jgi:hypothetical protein
MSLEGLNYVLEKDEIVATQHAEDLLRQPRLVDQAYKRHVKTYIPLGRQADSDDNGFSVEKFEQKVVRKVKDEAAVRGYLTAEYGYGKTSTALYLWARARKVNLLAVPPFQLNHLQDLVTATYGWTHYELERTRPGLAAQADETYEALVNRNLEEMADQSGADLATLGTWVKEGRLNLDLTSSDYVHFFEEMTALALEAGFEGMLVIPDEVQQYIEPEVKSGIKDPISPLFNIVQQILTRKGRLAFGLILVIPPKELSLLRDQRGDLVHRVLRLSLDLGSIYDREFPCRLWYRLADQFDFEDHRDRIVTDETLDALGQIAGRQDLSDGPRTVVNTFRRMTRRYLELGGPHDDPYTPRHLVNDFLSGGIEFDGPKRIQEVTSKALEHTLVVGRAERETAIKWAAAFPNEGIPREIQNRVGLTQAFDDLMQSAQGDLVIAVGDVKNPGITLRGLDQVEIATDWLSTTVREFWRNYYETTDITRKRSLTAFLNLLQSRVFPENQWKVIEQYPPDRLTQNAGLLLEGNFPNVESRFPKRRVHVRLLWEDEAVKDIRKGELVVQFRLRRHLDKLEEERRRLAEPAYLDHEERCIYLSLNLMYRDNLGVSPQLEQQIGRIVSPYKLTPLLMLTLFQVFEEKRQQNTIPKHEDQQVRYGLQPDLLENVFRNLFNANVGRPLDASEERIVEVALQDMLEALYPDYHTLMQVSTWSSSLTKYINALHHLETAHERQGQIVYEGTKDDVAELFTLSNTGLDSFVNNFPDLIVVEQSFPSRREANEGVKGAVRFRLHPLEKRIIKWLQSADQTERVIVGDRTHIVHRTLRHEVYQNASEMGYRDEEIDAILDLMEERGLVESDPRRGLLREAVTQAPSIDDLLADIDLWQADIRTLQGVFQSSHLKSWASEAEKLQQIIQKDLRHKPDDEKLIRMRKTVQARRRDLAAFAEDRHHDLHKRVSRMIANLPKPNRRQRERLEKSVQGSVAYVGQVDDLRARLRRKYIALDADVEKTEHEMISVQAAIVQENLSLEALTRLTLKSENLQERRTILRERRRELEEEFKQFAQWTDLVEKGSGLRQKMRQLGGAVDEQEPTFETLNRDIRGYLSAKKLDALPDAATYELRLQEIAEDVRCIEEKATERFNELQQRYREALRQELDFPQDMMWPLERYNPAAPDYSYQGLQARVSEALQEVLDRLKKLKRQQEEDIRSTQTSPVFQDLPMAERSELDAELNETAQDLEELDSVIKKIAGSIQQEKTLTDFPAKGKSGAFHELLRMLVQVRDHIIDIQKTVDKVTDRIRGLELSQEEEQLYRVLSQKDKIDLGRVRQAASSLDDQCFWNALRGLHAKRRIRVYVNVILRE